MYTWLFPGTFDPITLGHETTIRRASALCERLIVCVIDNYNKQPLFPLKKRMKFVQQVSRDISNVEVVYVNTITAEFAKSVGAKIILRGLRTSEEFEKEIILANYYNNVYPEIETIFLPSSRQRNDFTSSSLLKDVAFHNGDLTTLVNPIIVDEVKERFNELKEKGI